jgi:pentatricopeptide repeat protein
MSFHKSLITKIKSHQRNEVYILLQQLIPENSYIMTELKKNHLDLILSFISTEENPDLIVNYFNIILELYKKREWSLDPSSYSLVIRILASLSRFDEAFMYLEQIEEHKLVVKNRMIAPFFEHITDYNILFKLYKKYHNIMLEQEYYYLLKLANSESNINIKELIQEIFDIWINNDFISTNQELLKLVINTFNATQMYPIYNNYNARCNICNNNLTKQYLDSDDRIKIKNELLVAHSNSVKNLMIFQEWLNKTIINYETVADTIYIIDGGNVGHSIGGEFTFNPILKIIDLLNNSVVNKPFLILLVLHQKHFKKYKKEIAELDNNNIIVYKTPYNENDDIYWMFASFIFNYNFIITNDQLRDHHVNKLDETLFKRWKSSTLITYDLEKLYFPNKYSVGIQKSNQGYHIPFIKNDILEWYCLNV